MSISLHTYLQQLKAAGSSVDYINAVQRNSKPLVDVQLPVIVTPGQLSYVTDYPYLQLLKIIDRDLDPYRVFAIRKRSGGKRFICAPEFKLLELQRWIHHSILSSPYVVKNLSNNSTAYQPDASHIKNAKRHLSASWVIKLDITRFFESISERQVYRVFRDMGYRALVAFALTRVCTRILPLNSDLRHRRETKRWQVGKSRNFLNSKTIGHLPQGAPTSPMLANLVCKQLDTELQSLASNKGLTYTRYADDMTFSGDISDRAEAICFAREVSKIVGRYGFGINSQKTSIAKNGCRKIVTGISVEGDFIRLPRSYKDDLRKELYFIEKFGIAEHCSKIGYKNNLAYALRLSGKIKYANSVEPTLGAKLSKQFKQLFPDFEQVEDLVLNEFGLPKTL